MPAPLRKGSKPKVTDSRPSRRVTYEDGSSEYIPGRYLTTGGQTRTVNPEQKPRYPDKGPGKGQTTGLDRWGRDVTKRKPEDLGPKKKPLPRSPMPSGPHRGSSGPRGGSISQQVALRNISTQSKKAISRPKSGSSK